MTELYAFLGAIWFVGKMVFWGVLAVVFLAMTPSFFQWHHQTKMDLLGTMSPEERRAYLELSWTQRAKGWLKRQPGRVAATMLGQSRSNFMMFWY